MSVDIPRAWQITRAAPMGDHDPGCSYPRASGGMLCDCPVLTGHPEYTDDVLQCAGPMTIPVIPEGRPMAEDQVEATRCDHVWQTFLSGGQSPVTVSTCQICGWPDWDALNEQLLVIPAGEEPRSLVGHARRELELLGEFKSDPAYAQAIVAAVAAMASYGHSGGSAGCAAEQLYALVRYRALSPLTTDPGEWIDRSVESGKPWWQNARDGRAMSHDGGLTYWLCDDPDKTIHESIEGRGGTPRGRDNPHCSNCGSERGGPFGHEIGECSWPGVETE